MADINDVRDYWEKNPLLSHELSEVGSEIFFRELDKAKREDSDRFAFPYWEFDKFSGKNVLDVGCGPGWLTVQYALGGAKVSSVDLTAKAVELTQKHLELKKVSAHVQQGNAEKLPFDNEKFDLVISSGVLHHTPDTYKTFLECFRVLKPGGLAKITLYRKGILHSKPVFTLTRLIMRLTGVKHPGADLAKDSTSVEDFVRQYDGAANPIGIAKTNQKWAQDFVRCGFKIVDVENHFFPKRFIPFHHIIPNFIHYLLDRFLGTMVYFRLEKPL